MLSKGGHVLFAIAAEIQMHACSSDEAYRWSEFVRISPGTRYDFRSSVLAGLHDKTPWHSLGRPDKPEFWSSADLVIGKFACVRGPRIVTVSDLLQSLQTLHENELGAWYVLTTDLEVKLYREKAL